MNVEGNMATITITNIHGRLLATIEAENTADAIQKLVARGASLTGANLTFASNAPTEFTSSLPSKRLRTIGRLL